MDYKVEIKESKSSKTKLVFVKVPYNLENLTVDNFRNELSGNINTPLGIIDWFSPKLPKQNCKFIGYSHDLSDDQIESIFSSKEEFYQMCRHYEIFYGYSIFCGKWAVLEVCNS